MYLIINIVHQLNLLKIISTLILN